MDELTLELKPGEYLFHENEISKDLYIIKKGIVRVFKQGREGQLWPLALVHTGGFVGEMAFFDGKPRSASAQAVTEVVALKLEAAKLEHEIKKLPSWVMVMVRGLADRVRDANDLVKRNKIVDSTLQSEFEKWSSSVQP